MSKVTVKTIKSFVFNGVPYLGIIEKQDNGDYVISDAMNVKSSDFAESAREWIKAQNVNKLEKFTIEKNDNNQVIRKDFSEEQLLTLDIEAGKASLAIKYALGNLQNEAIDSSSY